MRLSFSNIPDRYKITDPNKFSEMLVSYNDPARGHGFGAWFLPAATNGGRIGMLVLFSSHKGWEHASVSLLFRYNRRPVEQCPSWEDMCKVKDLLWRSDEACVQYHPEAKDYVNCHPHTLHIWRPKFLPLPTPDPSMVF